MTACATGSVWCGRASGNFRLLGPGHPWLPWRSWERFLARGSAHAAVRLQTGGHGLSRLSRTARPAIRSSVAAKESHAVPADALVSLPCSHSHSHSYPTLPFPFPPNTLSCSSTPRRAWPAETCRQHHSPDPSPSPPVAFPSLAALECQVQVLAPPLTQQLQAQSPWTGTSTPRSSRASPLSPQFHSSSALLTVAPRNSQGTASPRADSTSPGLVLAAVSVRILAF